MTELYYLEHTHGYEETEQIGIFSSVHMARVYMQARLRIDYKKGYWQLLEETIHTPDDHYNEVRRWSLSEIGGIRNIGSYSLYVLPLDPRTECISSYGG